MSKGVFYEAYMQSYRAGCNSLCKTPSPYEFTLKTVLNDMFKNQNSYGPQKKRKNKTKNKTKQKK